MRLIHDDNEWHKEIKHLQRDLDELYEETHYEEAINVVRRIHELVKRNLDVTSPAIPQSIGVGDWA